MLQTPPLRSPTGRYAFAALIAANLMLAFGPWLVRLSDVGPVAAGFWRLALAVPFLFLLAGIGRRETIMPPRALFLMIVLGGLFFAADLAAWHYGIVRTKLANATLFGNMSSLIFALYGFLLVRRLPSRLQMAALGLAVAGSALLFGSSYELSPDHLEGDLFALLAGLFYTFYLIAMDRARRTMAPMPVLALSTLAGTAPLLLFALIAGEAVVPDSWTPLLLLSLGSQVMGQGLLLYAMGYLSPLIVGLGLLTQPAVTALIGWLAYDERLGAADLAGALLICIALVLIRLPDRR
ncbi:DMT family transporter [Allosphingosinicella flava]|uniref:DMT family transporter n=1 Tax=Allosphingosinicella flava TaxID=2771430 RepID=A0A7T2GIT8_9SPHN|nr:DMT family transporter [Sphingosinicella flava]QPQ54676.1 DMT family transporter [Sphingosinicella flava]